jgi:ABC-type uncharacterized transport system involved in gliding motility auxiliary subunit
MKVSRRIATLAALAVGLIALLVATALLTVRGQADTAVLVGLGLAAVGFIVAAVLDRDRWLRMAKGRQARYGANAALASLALLGILVLLNAFVFTHPKSWDLTEDQHYSLAKETVAALQEVTGDVRLIGFYSADSASARDSIRPLLQRYQEAGGGHVSYEFVDPRAQPLQAQGFGVTRDASLVVSIGQASEVVSAPTEQEITAAIIRLANPGERKVYFLTGHGERDVDGTDDKGYSQLKQALVAKNYTVEPLSLLVTPKVPADALAVVVAGPQASLSSAEEVALRDYVDGGGGLVALLDPTPGTTIDPKTDPLEAYLASAWGLALDDDLVVDLGSSLPLAAIAASYGTHPVTQRLQNLATYFPTARSIEVRGNAPATQTRTQLVLTGSNSWGEMSIKDLSQNSQIQFNQGEDLPGPLAVAAASEDSISKSRLVVIGDSDFAANKDYFGLGNGDLLVNSIDWAAHQDSLISLTPKPSVDRYVAPPSRQALVLIALLSIILVPAAFLILGVSTWWGRRARG